MSERTPKQKPKKEFITKAFTDPIGNFLQRQAGVGGTSTTEKLSAAMTKQNPERRAEMLWALFQKLNKSGLVAGRKEIKADNDFQITLRRINSLYHDAETRAAYLAGFKQHATERLTINSSYEQFQRLERSHERAEAAYDQAVAQMFGKRGQEDEDDVLTFEESKELLAQKRAELATLEKAKPEVSALVQYDTLRRYQEELARERFIWSPSRRQYLEAIEEAALSGKPVLLSGESGTGKSELAKATARKLTGREANNTPGKDVRLQDLIAKPKIDPRGGTYYEHKEIGEAVTGRESTLQKIPSHDGRFVLDDEFNLLDPAEQTARLAFAASLKPGARLRLPVTNEEITVAPKSLYMAMVNLASSRYRRHKMEAPILRKFAKVNIDYPEQSAQDPEIYEMMLAALMDENGRLLAVADELAPKYIFTPETRTEKINGIETVRQIRSRHLDTVGPNTHGFLWCLAESINQLNASFSHKPTVKNSLGEAQYVKDLIIDIGTVLGWLTAYRKISRARSLESYIAEQVYNEFVSKAEYTAEDRALVIEFFAHFGIDVGAKRVELEPKPFRVLTPGEVGRLSPRVAYYEVIKEEATLETSVYINEDGERTEYRKEASDAGGGLGRLEPGSVINLEGQEFRYLGVQVANGQLLIVAKEAGEDLSVENEFTNLNEAEAHRLGLERVEIAGNPNAQELINRITGKAKPSFGVASTNGNVSTAEIAVFAATWKVAVPNIPVPCVPGNYVGYIKALAEGRIITNLDKDHKIISSPHFDQPKTLWIENWVEGDYNNEQFTKTTSPLLKELGLTGKVTNTSREGIDAALWTGDPSHKQKTPQHLALIRKLGLDPTKHNLRLIAQDEYARLATVKNFGNSNLWTMFNDYQVEGETVYSLGGGYRDRGGASLVGDGRRGKADDFLAVRLVLERNN